MKKNLFTYSLIICLAIFSIQAESILPFSVSQFLKDRQMTDHQPEASGFAAPRMINGVEMIEGFIDIESSDVIAKLKQEGVIVNCEFDGFITAQIPVNRLTQICNLPGVIDVELGRLLEMCTDTTLQVTHAGQVLNGGEFGLPRGYDGTGVIVGIIDSGFDFQHIAFRKADDPSKTRIVRVYDYTDATGHPVTIGGNKLPGSVFMDDQIYDLTTDIQSEADINTHGTHTAGIAAGTHVNGYGGMAPGADIVLCVSHTISNSLVDSEIANFIKYIYAYADSVGKPCVISLSVSSKNGPRDGNDKVSKAVAQNTGPGHIFVVAAGNNGNSISYSQGATSPIKPYNILFGDSTENADDSYIYRSVGTASWVRATSVHPVMRFHILDKETGRIVWESDLVNSSKTIYSSDFSDYFGPLVETEPSYIEGKVVMNTNHRKYYVNCNIWNLKCKSYYFHESGKIISRYQVGVSIYPPSVVYTNQTDSCYLDTWVSTATGFLSTYNQTVYFDKITDDGDTVLQAIEGYYAVPSDECTINTIATGDSTISVGGYVARAGYNTWTGSPNVTPPSWIGNYAYFSSCQREGTGPTGTALPTITAPAYNVVSAYNHYANHVNETSPRVVMIDSLGNYWGAMSGTSMATPAVAGIIAQWLQINPTLGPNDIKDIIAQTANKDEFTQNEEFGYHFGPNGKIDAMAGARWLVAQIPDDEIQFGDVNGDGYISITDVTKLIDYLLDPSDDFPGFDRDAADLNHDGIISINDVSALIDVLLE